MHCFCIRSILFAFLLVMAMAQSAYPAPGSTPEPLPSPEDRAAKSELFPATMLFPPALADPHRTRYGAQIMHLSRTSIADSGDQRFNLQAGGRFGLLRIHPAEQPDIGWQFSIEGGFDAQFDIDHNLDNIGWDGNYGILLEHAPSQAVAFKVAALHVSSHLGDEHIIRTGLPRIEYTREEIAVAASWRFAPPWRVYAEAGRAYFFRNQQKPLRFQAGLEYTAPASLRPGETGWYAALDLQSWEERNWRLDAAFQAGILFRTTVRDWRFGLEYVNGRPTIGEFFFHNEEWTSLGAWIEW